jgi:hypothetical protein
MLTRFGGTALPAGAPKRAGAAVIAVGQKGTGERGERERERERERNNMQLCSVHCGW